MSVAAGRVRLTGPRVQGAGEGGSVMAGPA